MADSVKKPTVQRNTLKFKIEFEGKPERPINIVLYAFDLQGKFLASSPVKEGQAELALNRTIMRGFRPCIAPPLEERALFPALRERVPTLKDMEKLHAYFPSFHYDPKQTTYDLLPIPEEIWKWWLKCKCRVRGKVVKPVLIDATLVDKPVRDARVHICEVDPLWYPILHLPDVEIIRLRDDLLKELQKPITPLEIKPELPWPPPPPDPEYVFSLPGKRNIYKPQPAAASAVDVLSQVALNPQPLPPEPPDPLRLVALNPQPEPPAPPDPWRLVALNPQPEPPVFSRLRPSKAAEILQSSLQSEKVNLESISFKPAFETLSAEVRSSLLAPQVNAVRQTLAANYYLLYPYLCRWPWWIRWFCRCDEIAVVTTDHLGQFDTSFTYPCFFDHPDLYFWVEYEVEGVWTTVYHPTPICCHTYWNYACGSEVTIHVTDPRVHWSEDNPDLDGLNVVITTIGNGVSMSEIQKTGAFKGFTTGNEPFAGTLEMRMDLSRKNLIDIGVDHYRWSYRRLTYGDGTPLATPGDWRPMSRPVYRYYKTLVTNPNPPPTLKPYYPVDLMGPDPAPTLAGLDLFRIQPENPPAPGIEWSFLNEHVDMAYAYFETGSLLEADGVTPAAGQYEVKLELFNSTGALVNWSNPTGSTPPTPIDLFVSSSAAPFTPPAGMDTDPAPNDNLIKDPGGNVIGYTMTLYVDNGPCTAAIYDTQVQEVGSSIVKFAGECGFIEFAALNNFTVTIACRARQQYNHADFYFLTTKGSMGGIQEASLGWNITLGAFWTPVGSAANGFTRDSASKFAKLFTPSQLLGSCAQAAFAETIYVRHSGYDGYQRAYWLDASATPKAFALAPA